MSEDRVVHTIEKRDDERVCFSVSEYKGHPYVSIRVHFRGDDGQWHPTKKGITVSAEQLEEIERGVAALREAVDGAPVRVPRHLRRRLHA